MSSYECSDSVAEAQVQADEEAERSLRARYNDLLVDHARLAAQVLRVREFCAATNPIRGELHMAALHGWDTAMEMVLQLLESGEIKGFTFRIANLEGRTDD